jgi:hypothetical protein
MRHEWVYTGTLAQARRQYDDPEQRGVANNLWASDRSWFICTDYDLYGTKVSGSEHLIASIKTDPTLETLDLP